jgi:Asp-tRNA(Asn)/Glu-tRNA(Gln) amidotransferase C subunit
MKPTMRADEVVPTGDGSWAVKNAPEKSGNLFKVPPVL